MHVGLEIHLGCKVESIDYSNPGSIKLTTNKGSLESDAVLITVPLGVLKSK